MPKPAVDWKTLSTKQKALRLALLLLKSFLIAAVIVFIGSYTFFSPPVFIPALGSKILLFPRPPGDEYKFSSINGKAPEEVFLTNAQGNKLHAWYWAVPGATKTILFLHGNAGNIGHRLLHAKSIIENGASLMIVDYAGFGKSEGSQSLDGLVTDGGAAYEYLRNDKKIPAKDIVLYGESIGGAVVSDLARSKECAGIILDSTFSSIVGLAKKKISVYNMYPDFLQPTPRLNVLEYVSGKHPPLLIIHGKQDEIIPWAEAQSNFDAASEQKVLVYLPNSTHNWKEKDWDLYGKSIKDFVSSLPK